MSTQVRFFRVEEPAEGLRSRKKAKMRMMIEDAALRLFAEQGYEATTVEQIAAEVEISATTFFRYFPSKADVVLVHQDAHMAELRRVILEFPAEVSDMMAVRHAMLSVWVPNIDPEHTRRSSPAVATSSALRSRYDDLSRNWLEGIAQALADRRGIAEPDDEATLTARVALGVFIDGIRAWSKGSCDDGVEAMIKRSFDILRTLAADWARPSSKKHP